MPEPTFHILLIGADGYFPNRLSNGGTYRSLGGCVNDVERVEMMLRARIEGHQLAFTKLIARADPADPEGQPVGDRALWPTAENIRRALRELADRAQPGDQVYIHYSGHGGRAVTAFKKLKGVDGVDETLVPIDIGRHEDGSGSTYTRPERYIRDVELAYYLDQLASKVDGDRHVTTTLVFDSCHSGGVTRSASRVAKRSASGGQNGGTLDEHKLPDGAHSAEFVAAMAEAYARLRGSVPRKVRSPETTWLPEAEGYVLLAACRDIESAIEAPIDGRLSAGFLTNALLEALAMLRGDQTWKTVYDRILACTQREVPSQIPQLLGDIDRHVFGVELQLVQHTLTVARVDPDARTVTVLGGLALCITPGTELGIFPPGTTDFSLAENRLAIATVSEANGLESTAVFDASDDPNAIEVGAPVAIHALSLKHRVALRPRADLNPQLLARQEALLGTVADAIAREGNGFLELAAADASPDYQVALSPSSHFQICDLKGEPLLYLEPLIRVDERRAASAVVEQLRRIGRYGTVLQMEVPASDLQDRLQVELLVAPPDWRDSTPPRPVGGEQPSFENGAYTVPSETWMWLRLTNKFPDKPLNVALIDLNRKWEIELIVPNPNEMRGKKYESIGNETRTFAFKMYTPVPEAIDVLKLFIAFGDVDFPALATSVARTRSAAPRSPRATSTLGRLIDQINATERPRTREAIPPGSNFSSWTAIQYRMRTLRR